MSDIERLGPDLPPPDEPVSLAHWDYRWPMGAEKMEMVYGAVRWYGQYDARDAEAARRAFPGRPVFIDEDGHLIVDVAPGVRSLWRERMSPAAAVDQ